VFWLQKETVAYLLSLHDVIPCRREGYRARYTAR